MTPTTIHTDLIKQYLYSFMSNPNLKLLQEPITNEEFYQEVGNNIKTLREKAELSQAELAEQLEVSKQQIQRYEEGRASVYLHIISAIASTLGVSVGELME